jgi:hypothetical protein
MKPGMRLNRQRLYPENFESPAGLLARPISDTFPFLFSEAPATKNAMSLVALGHPLLFLRTAVGNSGVCFRNLFTGLQLRGQLRFYTGFPFHPGCRGNRGTDNSFKSTDYRATGKLNST